MSKFHRHERTRDPDRLDLLPNQHFETDMQALMETPPGQDIPESSEGIQRMRDNLEPVLAFFQEEDIDLLNMLFHEQLTVREAAERLGTSHTHIRRWRDKVLSEIGQLLGDDPHAND